MVNQGGKYRRNLQQFIPLLLIGLGLIFLGTLAVKMISDRWTGSEISVIPAVVSFPAPDLTLSNLNGEQVTITSFHQSYVLVNNWATWCPPCKQEMPALANYFEKHKDQGFLLIGIEAGEPKDVVAAFTAEYAIGFPILLDPENRSLAAFHNDSLPSSYVIDPSGRVVLAWNGPISLAMLEKYVTPLLEQ